MCCWAPARLEKRGDPPRTPLPVSVGCTSARACPSQRECSQRRRWLRTRHWRASGSQRGLTYLSLGAGGLFSDLMVLAGLLARGVRVSTVVLIDTIHEELIAAFQSPSAPPAPSTCAASGGSIVEEDPATGRVRLDVPFGAGRLPLSGHLAIRVRCAGQRGACSRRGKPRSDAASSRAGCGGPGCQLLWLALACGATNAGPEALDSRQAPRVLVAPCTPGVSHVRG